MLLSICIPTYNRCPFLRLSVRYWLEQLVPFSDRVELIIADNNSSDGTAALLEAYRDRGPFEVIRRSVNLGFNASTYDLVAQRASGEYVWVCGDDDYVNPGGLAEVIAVLEGHRDQDYIYVRTQFIPNDRAPDLEAEDPRESLHVRRPPGNFSNCGPALTREILERDGADFSGFYSSIWKRTLAIEALSGEFRTREPFTSLEATLPYAVYIARHRLEKPCCCVEHPILTVSHTVSWPQYASLFRLKIMPDLYDLYSRNGVSDAVLKSRRRELLDHWPLAFVDLFRHRRRFSMRGSFFIGYLARHAGAGRFWKELLRALWCDLLP